MIKTFSVFYSLLYCNCITLTLFFLAESNEQCRYLLLQSALPILASGLKETSSIDIKTNTISFAVKKSFDTIFSAKYFPLIKPHLIPRLTCLRMVLSASIQSIFGFSHKILYLLREHSNFFNNNCYPFLSRFTNLFFWHKMIVCYSLHLKQIMNIMTMPFTSNISINF